jgi:hypothetical protein
MEMKALFKIFLMVASPAENQFQTNYGKPIETN